MKHNWLSSNFIPSPLALIRGNQRMMRALNNSDMNRNKHEISQHLKTFFLNRLWITGKEEDKGSSSCQVGRSCQAFSELLKSLRSLVSHIFHNNMCQKAKWIRGKRRSKIERGNFCLENETMDTTCCGRTKRQMVEDTRKAYLFIGNRSWLPMLLLAFFQMLPNVYISLEKPGASVKRTPKNQAPISIPPNTL